MSSTGPISNLAGSSQQAGSKIPQHVLVVDTSGNPATFGGSGGTSEADSATFTATTTLGTPVMGAFETVPDTLTSGQLGIVALDTNRNLKVNVAAGGTSGTQYTEGDTDTTITGNAVMLEGSANALVAQAAGVGTSAAAARVSVATDGQPGVGTIATNQVSVGTSATLIVGSRTGRRSAGIVQHGTTAVYLGTSSVSTTNGLLLPGTAGAAVVFDFTGEIYGIVASGTQTVSYAEEY